MAYIQEENNMKLKHWKKKAMKDDADYSDVVYTPKDLAFRIVDHFKPWGSVLEPCCGTEQGYIDHPAFTHWCEVRKGKDFFDYEKFHDWIITNPPYSTFAQFLEGSLYTANEIVLGPIKADQIFSSKKRLRVIKEEGFGIREIVLMDTPPKPWPQTGFQYCAVWLSRNYFGPINFTDWRTK